MGYGGFRCGLFVGFSIGEVVMVSCLCVRNRWEDWGYREVICFELYLVIGNVWILLSIWFRWVLL